MRGWRGGWRWSALRPGSARRRCWPTGPGRAGGRSPGCHWTEATTTRPAVPRHVIAALDRMRPGTAEQLGPPPPPTFEALVTALINELAGQPGAGELLLVLDDYHLIDAQPVHASLGFLLEHRPEAALRLVLASRADPPRGLARLRGRGQAGRAARSRVALHHRGGGGGAAAPGGQARPA